VELDPKGAVELDPEIAAWLSLYPPPDIDFRDVHAVRALAAEYMSEHGGAQPRWPDDRVAHSHHVIGTVPIMLWRPTAAIEPTEPTPVVVALHGGAFIMGGPLGAERIAMPLAIRHGVATVSVDYRLAPEHPAPAALDDVIEVIANLDEIPGLDSSRVAVHGSSAGGALAAGVALWARDVGRRLALQSLSCPALDHQSVRSVDPEHSMAGQSPTLSRAVVTAMWDHYLGGSEPATYVVPAAAPDLRGVAPCHLTIAEYDVLRDEALAYAARLREAGVPVDVDLPLGTVHGFDGLLSDSRPARRALDRQVEALARALAD